MQRFEDYSDEELAKELDKLLAEALEGNKDVSKSSDAAANLPVIIRVEDKSIFRRLATDATLLPLQQKILNKLNLSADEWNEVVEKLDLPPEEWKAGRIQVQIISDDEKQFKHYNDRIYSLYDGVKFLLNSIPNFDEAYKQKLLQFLEKVTKDCSRQLKEISEDPIHKLEISHYQNSVADYTKYVLDVLRSQLDMPIKRKGLKKVDELGEQLARAEEFALAQKTKPAIVTVSSLLKDPEADLSLHNEFMVMIDKPENPFSNFTDTPKFREDLDEELKDLNVYIATDRTYGTEFGYTPPGWYTTLSASKQKEVDDLFKHFDFNDASDHAVITNGVMSIAYPTIKTDLNAIKTGNTLLYPKWFKSLKDYEKRLLRQFLENVDLNTDLGTTINAISSKLRLIPVPSNYGTHTLITHMKKAGEVAPTTTEFQSEKRSSHAASRDVKGRGSEVRSIHAEDNVFKMIDDLIAEKMKEFDQNTQLKNVRLEPDQQITIHIPILYQTLITPFKEPDTSLDEDKQKAVAAIRKTLANAKWFVKGTNNQVQVKFDLISTNHPLNVGKYLTPTSSADVTGSEIAKLLSTVTGGGMRIYGAHGIGHKNFRKRKELKQAIKNNNPLLQDGSPETKQRLNLLTDAVIKLANIVDDKRFSMMMGSYRELYISSLEQIVTSLAGGGSIGSCVSGKDRKAIEIAHTDAMQIFYTRYGRLPPPNPPLSLLEEIAEKLHAHAEKKNFTTLQDKRDSDEFAKIFAEIYCTKHQQFLAGQNAPGSFGTKTPGMYLPPHLKKAVNDWYKAHDIDGTPYKGLSQRNIMKEDDRRASNNEISKIKSMFSRAKRLLKIFRKKPAMHLPPDDLRWKSSTMDNREIYSLNEEGFKAINAKALVGLANYAAEEEVAARKTGLFSHASEAKKELTRIHMFQSLLGDQSHLSSFQKNVLLYAIMQGKNDPKLQQAILQSIQIPTLESARYILASNIKRVMNEHVEKKIGAGEIVAAQRAQELANLEKDINTFVNEILKFVDQKIVSDVSAKKGDKKVDKKGAAPIAKPDPALDTEKVVESMFTSMNEKELRMTTSAEVKERQALSEKLQRIL